MGSYIHLLFVLLAQLALACGRVNLAGVNIAGFDFGCTKLGIYNPKSVTPPLASKGHADGIGQMHHFAKDDGLNIFRLPVCWQYLVGNKLGASLDATAFAVYDELVQACLGLNVPANPVYCLIDIHNYARWDNMTIGQSDGAVTNDQIASVWSQIAAKYQYSFNVIFGIMNEPHDLNIETWAATVQHVVTAIRTAGATSQIILLPGTGYTNVGGFVSSGSAASLNAVKNLDGSNTNLIFDVHQYLDATFVGTNPECTSNGVGNLKNLATYLRSNGRKALLSETGGGSTSSCYTNVCAELDYMNLNNDVFLGWIGWAAGSFSTSYSLSQTPTLANGVWTDTGIVKECIAGKFK